MHPLLIIVPVCLVLGVIAVYALHVAKNVAVMLIVLGLGWAVWKHLLPELPRDPDSTVQTINTWRDELKNSVARDVSDSFDDRTIRNAVSFDEMSPLGSPDASGTDPFVKAKNSITTLSQKGSETITRIENDEYVLTKVKQAKSLSDLHASAEPQSKLDSFLSKLAEAFAVLFR